MAPMAQISWHGVICRKFLVFVGLFLSIVHCSQNKDLNSDADGDGIPDYADVDLGGTDLDGDGIRDDWDADVDGDGTNESPDADGDGIRDNQNTLYEGDDPEQVNDCALGRCDLTEEELRARDRALAEEYGVPEGVVGVPSHLAEVFEDEVEAEANDGDGYCLDYALEGGYFYYLCEDTTEFTDPPAGENPALVPDEGLGIPPGTCWPDCFEESDPQPDEVDQDPVDDEEPTHDIPIGNDPENDLVVPSCGDARYCFKVSADDRVDEVYVNGVSYSHYLTDASSRWSTNDDFGIQESGEVIIAIKASDTAQVVWGMKAEITDGAGNVLMTTPAEGWLATHTPNSAYWMEDSYDDSDWETPYIQEYNWNEWFQAGIWASPDKATSYFRYRITLE